MQEKVLLIRHMPGERDDRVSRELTERGFLLETCRVAEGQPLPDPGGYAATVIYGGAQMVSQAAELDYLAAELRWIEGWLRRDKPLLGICLGGQLLAHSLGAAVGPHPEGLSEIGYYPIRPTPAGKGLIPDGLQVYHWHLQGFDAPADGEVLACGVHFENQAFRYGRAYGLQFHPEITREIQGGWMAAASHMLSNPGAHPLERQLADNERHLAPLGSWLSGFMDHWLAGVSGRAVAEAGGAAS